MGSRFAATLAAAACLVLGAGCGSQAERNDREPEAVVTSEALIADFRAQPGKPALRRQGGSDGKFEQLGLGFDPPLRLVRRYGTFSIYVVDPGDPQAKAALLTDKTTGKPLEQDADGIYWEYDEHSDTWIANGTYGENVVLVWFSEKRTRATDARWERLDAFLTESTAA